MARIDFDSHEIQAVLMADRRKGLWANQIAIRNGRAIRTAGQLPTTASRHSLLAVSLASALRAISKKQAETLVRTAKESIAKPRIRVITSDEMFAEALTAAANRQRTEKRLRVGKNFISVVAAQVARFDVSIHTAPADDPSLNTLKTWAKQNVIDPKDRIPAALTPTVASALV